ncbi:Lipoprotein OS=Lysinibacillus sphaericus OX=1421 GN=LS41612_16835 PE=4 SV=1 [Lysinibacillus sphaericus]
MGCSNEEVNIVKKHEVIEIGIVGEIPSLITENNIKFKKIMLQDLHKKNEDSFDAIMITKDYLQEASDEQYTQFYLNSSIPIVFVQSESITSFYYS